jgi:hypothetical protein
MDAAQAEKPRSVTLAVTLLWVSFAIGIVRMPLDPAANLKAIPHPAIVWPLVALILAFFCLIILKISSGKNWARITFLVVFLLTLVLGLPSLAAELARAPVLAAVSIASGVMQAYAAFLLFTSPGKSWFQKKAAG